MFLGYKNLNKLEEMILRTRGGGCFWREEVGCDRNKALGVVGWLPGFYLWLVG